MIRAKLDVTRLLERMRNAQARLPYEIDLALDRVAQSAVEDLKGTSSFDDKSGTLRRSFAAQVLQGFKRRIVAGDFPSVPYAKYLERGTRASADSWTAHMAISLRRAVGFAADAGLRRRAGSWRIRPRRFFEHARNVVRRRLKGELLQAVHNALKR